MIAIAPKVVPAPCPNCHAPSPRKLDELSLRASFDYHRCDTCQHVWSTNKQTHSIVMHVTRLTRVPLEHTAG